MPEAPRYRLTRKAYMRPQPNADMDQLLPEGTEVEYLGEPGEHMEPINDAAAERVAASGGGRSLRPELKLAMRGDDGGEAGKMLRASLGLDFSDQANVVAALAQALVRLQVLEAQVAELRGAPRASAISGAPPPPPPPRKAAG